MSLKLKNALIALAVAIAVTVIIVGFITIGVQNTIRLPKVTTINGKCYLGTYKSSDDFDYLSLIENAVDYKGNNICDDSHISYISNLNPNEVGSYEVQYTVKDDYKHEISVVTKIDVIEIDEDYYVTDGIENSGSNQFYEKGNGAEVLSDKMFYISDYTNGFDALNDAYDYGDSGAGYYLVETIIENNQIIGYKTVFSSEISDN